MGAGLELAVACDFRVATLRSEFAFPEVRLGMIPGSGGTQRALRLIGMTRAKLFMMTGQRIPAERAEAWGLITQAVPERRLDAAVTALAGELAERPPLALRTLKMVLNRGADAPLETALELERKAYAWLRSHARLRRGRARVPRQAAAEVPGAIGGVTEEMSMAQGSFGLILANRAVVLGAIKARDLLDQAEQAEASGVFDSVWVGDSLLAKPRLESIALLSALAGVTRRVRLAVGCMATFVHRHPVLLAQQWASLDVLSEGRALLAVCLGGPDSANAAQAAEHAVMGIASGERVERLEEGIAILRTLFGEAECQPRRPLLSVRQGRRCCRGRSSSRARSGSRPTRPR